jgi:hypothetical protein
MRSRANDLWPNWAGRTVCVIASGPSAPATVARIERRPTSIAINRSYELAPWADALYAVDRNFWVGYPLAFRFAGLKIAGPHACDKFPILQRVNIAWSSDHSATLVPCRGPIGTLGSGLNSGFQAVNLAAQLGAARIALVGFDFRPRHWHPDHDRPCRNPQPESVSEWARILDDAAPIYRAWGVDIVNCSPISTLTAYRRADIREALEELADA